MFRVANASGFYPDWFHAMDQHLDAGNIDVITGDYLAELTMGILSFTEAKGFGYAKNFVEQLRSGALKKAADQGVKILVNAGGLQPEKCAREVAAIAEDQGVSVKIAWVEGDDLRPNFSDLLDAGKVQCEHDLSNAFVMTSNAYFGCFPIVEALHNGADIVITGRCTDASPVMAAAAWKFGWKPTDYNELAGALVAGHIIECGGQATGGNYSFFQEVETFDNIGFPIAEFEADGSAVITKPKGTGGRVTVDTIKAQLFYEIGPQGYLNPDATARLDTIQLEEVGKDRVRLSGTQGAPPPPTLKVTCNVGGGYRNVVGIRTAGPNIEAKIALLKHQVWDAVGPKEQYDEWIEYQIGGGPSPDSPASNLVDFYVGVKSMDKNLIGRKFSDAIVQLTLRSVPGLTLCSAPGSGSPILICRSAYIPRDAAMPVVKFTDDDTAIDVPLVADCAEPNGVAVELPAATEERKGTFQLKDVCGTRSGDKGGDANLGVWVRGEAGLAILHAIDCAFVAEATNHPVDQIQMYDFPNLLGRNFILKGFLGDGVAASLQPDAQAKTLGEFLRAQTLTL